MNADWTSTYKSVVFEISQQFLKHNRKKKSELK